MLVSVCWIWAFSQGAVAKRFSYQQALDLTDLVDPKTTSHAQSHAHAHAHAHGHADSHARVQSDYMLASSLPNLNHLEIGGEGEALVPALVPAPNTYFHWKSKEKRRFILHNNEYKWELEDVCDIGKDCEHGPGKVMHAKGGWTSNEFGKQLIAVRDLSEREIFIIRREKHVWNPFQMRTVFRIYAPLPSDDQYNDAEPLFTINRDIFGKGVFWGRTEYRVYKGRVRHNQPLYYGITGYAIWSRMKVYRAQGVSWDEIYKQEKGKKHHEKRLMAGEIQKKQSSVLGDLAVGGSDLIPDKFNIKVYAGEDSALMLTLAALWDMKLDHEQGDGGLLDTALDIAT